jgi:hypothetical protein
VIARTGRSVALLLGRGLFRRQHELFTAGTSTRSPDDKKDHRVGALEQWARHYRRLCERDGYAVFACSCSGFAFLSIFKIVWSFAGTVKGLRPDEPLRPHLVDLVAARMNGLGRVGTVSCALENR